MVEQETMASKEEVAEVLRQLKGEIEERHRAGETAETAGWRLSRPATLATMDRVHVLANVNAHVPIAWPSWPRGVVPKAAALAQKVTRRLLRWYINPMVQQQNQFNAAVAQALETLWQEVAWLQEQAARAQENSRDEG